MPNEPIWSQLMGSTATPNDSKTTRTRPRHDPDTIRKRPGNDSDTTRTRPNSPPIQKKCKVVPRSKNRDGTRLIYPHLLGELGTTRTDSYFFSWHIDRTPMTRSPDGSLVSECAIDVQLSWYTLDLFEREADRTLMTRPLDGSFVSECAVKLVYPQLVRAQFPND